MDAQTITIFNGARALMAKSFPYLTEGTIEEILKVCAKNEGLLFPPVGEPDFLFAYWRFWPKLIELVKNGEWGDLERYDLRTGPILYIAAFVMPKPAYSCVRELIAVLNPFAVCCHRYDAEDGEFSFHFRRNMRFSKERLERND